MRRYLFHNAYFPETEWNGSQILARSEYGDEKVGEERSSRKGDLKKGFKVKEMSSISTLEVAWEHKSSWPSDWEDERYFCFVVARTNTLELLEWMREEKGDPTEPEGNIQQRARIAHNLVKNTQKHRHTHKSLLVTQTKHTHKERDTKHAEQRESLQYSYIP